MQFKAELSRDKYHWEIARWSEGGPVEVIVIVDETSPEDDRMRICVQEFPTLRAYCRELIYSRDSLDFSEETAGSKLIVQELTDIDIQR